MLRVISLLFLCGGIFADDSDPKSRKMIKSSDNVTRVMSDFTINEGDIHNGDINLLNGDLAVYGTINGNVTVYGTVVLGNSAEINMLINRYKKLQLDKGFSGIPESLIIALAKQYDESWEFNLFFANEHMHKDIENSVGVLVSIHHGDTATYFIGSTNDKGRNLNANYVLLWEAIMFAKHSGCKWFDIGGLDSTTPKGIAHFKHGLNFEPYNLVGEWRGFFAPWKSKQI